MDDLSAEDSLNTEEGKQRAESLFSKNFRDYLTNKKSDKVPNIETSFSYNSDYKFSTLARDCSVSSCETSGSESSRKSGKRLRKKEKERVSLWDIHFSFRNKVSQCSLLKNDVEVVPPEDLKPLLVNMTILLQDLKQSPRGCENLFNLVSRITILVAEFIRRPLKKIQEGNKGEYAEKVEKTIDMMLLLLQEYKDGPNLDPDNSIREYKRIEREISQRDLQIAEANRKLSGGSQKSNFKTKDMDYRVRSSILANDKLKSDIKFNQNHLKKCKKILLEKEWAKHKLETELTHLKKKISKVDLCDVESTDRNSDSLELNLKVASSHGSSLSKIKTTRVKKGKDTPKVPIKPK